MTAPRKSALILGAGSRRGIGRACAERFAGEGYQVIIWDARIEGQLPEGWLAAKLDITDWERLEFVSRDLPDLSAAINCVAIGARTSILKTSKADWDRIVAVNLNGAFYAAHHIQPALARGRGTYVNFSSIFAENTFPNRAAYCVTKASLVTLTRCMAIEWAPDGIRVLTITPGLTKTGVQMDQILSGEKDVEPLLERTAERRMVEREEVANVVFAVCQRDFSGVTGANINVDVGYDVLGGGFWGLDRLS